MIMIFSLLQILENKIIVPLKYMIKILQIPRFSLHSISIYANLFLQLQKQHLNTLHMEKSIFVLKRTWKLPIQHIMPTQGHWLNWLTQFLILNHLIRDVLLVKVHCSKNNLKQHMVTIGAYQSLSNSAIYEHRCLENI